jgi:hypothetical protein
MKTKQYIILAICIFIAITALTNPDNETHKEKVKLKMNEFYDQEMAKEENSSNDQYSQAGKSMGIILGRSLINTIIDNAVSSSNYILFSTTEVTWEGKTKTVGIGILGNVFLSSEIDKALKK